MKLRVLTTIALAGVFMTASALAAEVEIKCPTMVCQMCCDTIVKAVKSVEGVTDVKPDMEKKVMRVTYNTKENLRGKIEKTVSKAGYQANNVKADAEAFANLPGCCKAKPAGCSAK